MARGGGGAVVRVSTEKPKAHRSASCWKNLHFPLGARPGQVKASSARPPLTHCLHLRRARGALSPCRCPTPRVGGADWKPLTLVFPTKSTESPSMGEAAGGMGGCWPKGMKGDAVAGSPPPPAPTPPPPPPEAARARATAHTPPAPHSSQPEAQGTAARAWVAGATGAAARAAGAAGAKAGATAEAGSRRNRRNRRNRGCD